jgi:excisionase family DNA binding protein
MLYGQAIHAGGRMQTITPHSHELPLVLKAGDIQRLLGLSRVKTYELLHQKGFPVVRIGRCLRVPRDAFFRWLEAGGN